MKLARNILSQTVVNGVTYTVVKPRKTPTSRWMSAKNSKNSTIGTSGFATGFPRKSAWSK
jgi:hypothetical protein